jgi:oxysterol-binding protein-related protein 9/10/11
MTFSGSINIKQTGHAMLYVDKYSERYLIPFPDVKVKGLLSGHLYPELSGKYHIISSSGFISEIVFSGQGYFSGKKNSVFATVYRRDDQSKTPIYTIKGQWSDEFEIFDSRSGDVIETWRPTDNPVSAPQVSEIDDQDPWETRRAWGKVITALKSGDLQVTMIEKSKLEEAQRAMRKTELSHGTPWEPLFFTSTTDEHHEFEALASATGWKLQSSRTKGVWRFDGEKAKKVTRPYHESLEPLGPPTKAVEI